MIILELLERIKAAGISLWVEGDELRFRSGKGALTAELREQLSKHRDDIMAFLSHAERLREGARGAIPALHGEAETVASFAQEGLWLMEQLHPGTILFHIPMAYTLAGPLDASSVCAALVAFVRRHPVLRCGFSGRDAIPKLLLSPSVQMAMPLIDLSQLNPESRADRARLLVRQLAQRPFQLDRPPLFRAVLLRLEEREHVLAVNVHHLVFDGWSLGIFLNEWRALYSALLHQGEAVLPALPISYLDFAAYQRFHLSEAALSQQTDWWERQLRGLVPIAVCGDAPRPPTPTYEGANLRFSIPDPLTKALARMAESAQTSLFTVISAGLLALLGRHTGARDLSLGTAHGHRPRTELEGVVGLFVNLLTLRVQLDSSQGFAHLLAAVREASLEALKHQDVPFERVVEACRAGTAANMHPLFNIQIVMASGLIEETSLPGVKLTPFTWGGGVVARKDLTFMIGSSGDRLLGDVEYHSGIFKAATVARLVDQLLHLLQQACAAAHTPLRQLDALSSLEKSLLERWNDTRTSFPRDHTLHRLFEITSRQFPDRPAVHHGSARMTYPELNGRANRLASLLRRHGVAPGDRVAFCLEQGPDRIATLLAVLKLGACYVPLDARNPEERILYILEDTCARLVLTDSARLPLLENAKIETLVLDQASAALARERADNPGLPIPAEAPAYIMYTSGSTGQPKGVMIHHRGVVRLVRNREFLEVAPKDVFLQAASVAFDASTLEIWAPLLNGALLVLMTTHAIDDLPSLLQIHQVSILWLTAQLFHLMVDRHLEALASVSQLLAGGEALSSQQVMRFCQRYPKARLINGYGPTENTTFTCCAPLHEMGVTRFSVPIGGPISNTRVQVLDAQLRLSPLGSIGQLWTSGDGLALGYLNRPALTAERFVPDASASKPGERIYGTGDQVRWISDEQSPSACLELWGRLDRQIKLRGFRIEPGEVERILELHPEVRGAYVSLATQGPAMGTLVGYVCWTGKLSAQERTRAELQAFLMERIPAYMVPSALVLLEAFPLTANGKLDVQALPAADPKQDQVADLLAPPATPTEELIGLIWADLLELETCSRFDNFFDLGGHSLLVNRLMGELMESFKIELPVRSAFEHPRLVDLAAHVDKVRGETSGQMPAAIQLLSREPGEAPGFALSFAQERLWFLDRLEPGNAMYSVPVAVRMRGNLFLETLRGCFNEIMRRHEALRTHFIVHEGLPRQIIEPELKVPFTLVDLMSYPREKRERACMRRMTELAQVPFSLERGPLLRLVLYRLAENDHILLMNMHHIVSDGWSLRVLFSEMSRLYAAYTQNMASPLDDLPLQYVDYAAWQRQWLTGPVREAQFVYWRDQLAGLPGVLELPLDFARPRVQTFRGAGVRFAFSLEDSARFRSLIRQRGVTPFMALISVYACLLARYSGQRDIAIGTPIANRSLAALQRLIGFFLNTLVLRFSFADQGAGDFSSLLARTRRLALDAYAHQELPFEQVVARLQPERDMSRPPLFQAAFSWDSETSDIEVHLPGLLLKHYAIDYRIAKFDLSLGMGFYKNRLYGSFGYNKDLFRANTIERMSKHFQHLFKELIRHPESNPLEVELMSPREREALLVDLNQTGAPSIASARTAFEAITRQHYDRIALSQGERTLRYGHLNRDANRLARHLRDLGIAMGAVVAICCEASMEMILAQLAVLKSGAAFLPLDPGYPHERLCTMLKDSGARLLLTTSNLWEELAMEEPEVFLLDEQGHHWQDLHDLPSGNLLTEDVALAPAYMIYTSGSSGQPKGVVVTQQGLANLISWHQRSFAVTCEDRATKLAQVAFDASVWETWPYLCAGARVFIPQGPLLQQPDRLRDWLQAMDISICFLPTPVTEQVLALDWSERGALRYLLTGGDYLHRFPREGLPFVLVNNYGPTENAVVSTSVAVRNPAFGQRTPPIGLPIQNMQVYITDRRLKPIPPGVPGELLLGGVGLALGYHARLALTASAFVPNPFARDDGDACAGPGSRLYRSGDLARFICNDKGQIVSLEFLGRIGNQVKLRGFRIELGEIEHHLCAFAGVADAVALVVSLDSGEKKLVGFVLVPEREAEQTDVVFDIAALREHMAEKLPYYMVPAALVVLAEFPKTPNGKVDRRALASARHYTSEFERHYVPPHSGLEQALTRIWSEVLGLEEVGAQTNFFDLGGHSLQLARVQSKMAETLQLKPDMVELFQFPTIRALVQHLRKREHNLERLEEERSARMGRSKRHFDETAIAVIGFAGRFPAAPDTERFWHNLRTGLDAVQVLNEAQLRSAGVPSDLYNRSDYVRRAAPLADVALFDAAFFAMTPREAQLTDPQQRLMLETCWHGLEHAGYAPQTPGVTMGVYAGVGSSFYLFQHVLPNHQVGDGDGMPELLGNEAGFTATRIAYKLDLKGPAITVQTACSSSLVAVHLASLGLLNGECDLALAGGVSLSLPQDQGYLHRPGGVLAVDGVCRAFDEAASGTLRGSGLAVVVLRRLAEARRDRDTVYAVIRGTAVNNDGAQRAGFTAPSPEGQRAVIREALAVADVEPASLGYLETHGTATPLGDAIEIEALRSVFAESERRAPLELGSLKTNLGHLDAAAGIVGLLKVVLCLHHKTLVPSLHFQSPMALLARTPQLAVNTETRPWLHSADHPRRAGVSSFGIGGTNVHAILEEAMPLAQQRSLAGPQLLILSAVSVAALQVRIAELRAFADAHAQLDPGDLAYTLALGRAAMSHRAAFYAVTLETFGSGTAKRWERVCDGSEAAQLVFVFSGLSLPFRQWANDLYGQDEAFRNDLKTCAALLDEPCPCHAPVDLLGALYPPQNEPETPDGDLRRLQPLWFCLQWALAQWVLRRGLAPSALIGQGLGELVAATLAGVFSLKDAVHLVAARGMLLAGNLDVDPWHPMSDARAAHCDSAVAALWNMLGAIRLNPPTLPMISSSSGTWLRSDQACDPSYWAEQVQRNDAPLTGVEEVLSRNLDHFVVFGTGVAWSHPPTRKIQSFNLLAETAAQTDLECLYGLVGQLWLRGYAVDWRAQFQGRDLGRVPLPVYPFQRQRYWLDPPKPEPVLNLTNVVAALDHLGYLSAQAARGLDLGALAARISELSSEQGGRALVLAGQDQPESWTTRIMAIWRECLGIEVINCSDHFFDLGGDSLTLSAVAARLRDYHGLELTMGQLFDAPILSDLVSDIEQILGETVMTKASEPDPLVNPVYSLSPAQLDLWNYEKWLPGTPTYQLPFALEWKGCLDIRCAEAGILALVAQHPALRTAFTEAQGHPSAWVMSEPSLHVWLVDLKGLKDSHERMRALVEKEASLPFKNLSQPLFRAFVFRLHEQHHVLVFKVHHLVFDGYSLKLLLHDFLDRYQRLLKGEHVLEAQVRMHLPPVQECQAAHLSARVEHLCGGPTAIDLPYEGQPGLEPPFPGAVIDFCIPDAVSHQIVSSCQALKITPFSLMLGVWANLLLRYCGQEEVFVGSPISRRQSLEMEQAIGYFVQVGVTRHRREDPDTPQAICERVSKEVRQMLDHGDVPLNALLNALDVARQSGVTPLFQVLFSLENAGGGATKLPGARLDFLPVETGVAVFVLDLAILQTVEGFHGRLVYRRDAMNPTSAKQMCNHYVNLLSSWLLEPMVPTGQHELIDPTERHYLLEQLSGPAVALPEGQIFNLFEAQVQRRGEAPAIVGAKHELSYTEVLHEALRVAQFLYQRGAQGRVVATMLPRGADLITAGLAIWSIGACWLPLDVQTPQERLNHILKETVPELIISSGRTPNFRPDLPWLLLDEDRLTLEVMPPTRPEVPLLPDLDAYIIFTSGTTGKPKGVCISQRGLANHHRAIMDLYQLSEGDRVAQISSPGFDVVFEEVYPTLLSGGVCVPFTRMSSLTVSVWSRFAEAYGITVANLPTALWQVWCGEIAEGMKMPPSLRLCITGTEAVDPIAVAQWCAHVPYVPWFNAYGTTESAITNLCWPGEAGFHGDRVPVGRPLAGTRVFVLDRAGQLQAQGLRGELLLGGAGLARCYLARPGLTAARFVPDAFSGDFGARLFRSGDQVRFDGEDNLQFLGRMDRQLKLRGYRLEPEEIERVICQHAAIQQAVVFLKTMGDERILVAVYLVGPGQRAPEETTLRHMLVQSLPVYMVPALYKCVTSWPVGPQGKTDSAALSALFDQTAGIELERAPASGTAQIFLEVWRQLLGQAELGLGDNLFLHGAHSLMISRAAQKLSAQFAVELPWTLFFEQPSCAAQASYVDGLLGWSQDGTDGEEAAELF